MSLYVTVNEFKQAPTAIDLTQLDMTNVGNQQAQDNALANILHRASAWVDNIVKYSLQASQNTETKEVNFTRDGRLVIYPDNLPVLSLTNVQYRLSPALDYTVINLQYVQQFSDWFAVYTYNQNVLSPNLVLDYQQVGFYSPYQKQRISDFPVTAQYTYLNGYFNGVLTVNANAGDTAITVDNALGLSAGSQFTIYDGDIEENCVVSSVSGNTITLQSALLFAHISSTSVSALPAVVKQATILLAGYLIKERGAASIVMGETAIGGVAQNYSKREDVDLAKELLKPLVRVVVS